MLGTDGRLLHCYEAVHCILCVCYGVLHHYNVVLYVCSAQQVCMHVPVHAMRILLVVNKWTLLYFLMGANVSMVTYACTYICTYICTYYMYVILVGTLHMYYV